jgi:hypothetical protein
LIACVGALATPVEAHQFSPAKLEVRENPDQRLVVALKVGPGASEHLAVVLPKACFGMTAPTRSSTADGVIIRWQAQCDASALVGESLALVGLDAPAAPSDVLVEFHQVGGRVVRAVLYAGQASFRIPGPTDTSQVIGSYVSLGVRHILGGIDHLLFVLCLFLLVDGRRMLFWTVSAFTLGHSVTLSLAALEILTLPSAPTEVTIALSVLILARELLTRNRGQTLTMRVPWVAALAFGLLHGLGFAGALAEVGLPRDAIVSALVSFNAGVELGQLVFVLGLALLRWLWRRLARRGRLRSTWSPRAQQVLFYAIGVCAASWTIERVAAIM